MKLKHKKSLFIFEITESNIKIVKYWLVNHAKRELAGAYAETFSSNSEEAVLSQIVKEGLKKLSYDNGQVILLLPRHNATCRYLKVPAEFPKEIEKIISLQASRYLPYPNSELITAYQKIVTDKSGYSDINLIIAHRAVIERSLKLFAGLVNFKNITVLLSSFGLAGLHNFLFPSDEKPAIIIDADFVSAEVAVSYQQKLLFSRSLRVTSQNWQNVLIEEVNKTSDAYNKEFPGKPADKLIVFSSPNHSQKIADFLSGKVNLPVSAPAYWEKIPAEAAALNALKALEFSFAGLLGGGLGQIQEPLNLMPLQIREKSRLKKKARENLNIAFYAAAIMLIIFFGASKHLDNKRSYLQKLKEELKKVEIEAKSIEELKKRQDIALERLRQKPQATDVLYEINQIIPQGVSLVNIGYEEGKQLIIHGYTPELNNIFQFAGAIEKSAVLKNFDARLRYATKKKLQGAEVVDFEITCVRR
ncbi:MAG: PilN domain-containing protein [Candidatus Omnitrophota bacterium]